MTTVRSIPIPSAARRLALAAALGLAVPAAARADVDLAAVLVNGPGQVHVGGQALVTVQTASVGDPFAGSYTIEVLLSQDFSIDPDDPVVATLTTDLIGPQHVIADIPMDLPDVQHKWVMRILPVPGESNLTNNVAFGPATNVIKTDLELEDPDPIQVFVRASDDPPEPIAVRVNNVGTPKSILVFTVQPLTPAPWLTLDPPSSFAIGDQEGNDIFLLFDHSALEPGDYPVVLRFQNFADPDDFEDLSVTLTVGKAAFHPGHKFLGQISAPGETDEVVFHALAGERLMLEIKSRSGDLRPQLTFFDPDGQVEKVLTLPHSKKYLHRTVKLKRSGEYTIVIGGQKGTVGGYKVKTKAKWPKKGSPHTVKIKNPSGGVGTAEVLMLPDGILEFSVDPNAAFSGPLGVALTTPSGVQFDISANSRVTATGELVVEGVPITEVGSYSVSVFGFGGGKKEKVKVHFLPFQPPQKKGKIYLK